MSRYLALETSSQQYAVAVGDDEKVVFSTAGRPSQARPDLQGLVAEALASVGMCYRDIDVVGVDRGPGGLSSTRAGVSFANALMFSLGVPLHAFSYFDVVERQAAAAGGPPLLCAVPAASGNAYLALRTEGSRQTAFGPLAETAVRIAHGHAELAVAGRLRERLAALLPDARLVDTGIDGPDPAVLLELTRTADRERRPAAALAVPLNELAPEFGHGR